MPGAVSPAKTQQPKAEQMGPWPTARQKQSSTMCTCLSPHPPQLTCCHGQPRSLGQILAMSRTDSGKADPACRRVLPGGKGVCLMHRLLCAALWSQAAFKSH